MQTKEPELKNAFDDWLARIVCFAFSVSPQALVSQINRATAEVQKVLAEEEGFAPVLAWVKALVDDVLAAEFDAPDLEFAWSPSATVDPLAQEQMLSSYTSRGILTLNEARAALGRPPLADPAADQPMALTPTGYVGLEQTAATPSGQIGKAGNWDESQHPRWPAGDGDHQGGRFAPAGAGSSAPRRRLALAGVLIDRRYDEVIGITHCTYSTPFDTFTLEHKGFYSCDPTWPVTHF